MGDAYDAWSKICLVHAFAMLMVVAKIWEYLGPGPTPADCDVSCYKKHLILSIAHNDMILVSSCLLVSQFVFLLLAPCVYFKLEEWAKPEERKA
jgi:hypothetical protein